MNIIITTGKAARLGALAPHSCKSLTMVAGRPIIEWQLDVLGDATILCRSDHADLLSRYGRVVVNDSLSGPAGVLRSVRPVTSGQVTVVYADSWFSMLPGGDSWVGVKQVQGGRSWDVVGATVEYRHVPEGASTVACVGIYRFPDHQQLNATVNELAARTMTPVGMAPVVNRLRPPAVMIDSWMDVGDPAALASASTAVARMFGTLSETCDPLEGVMAEVRQ